jgi:8-oxo-dGTP diphosphatase
VKCSNSSTPFVFITDVFAGLDWTITKYKKEIKVKTHIALIIINENKELLFIKRAHTKKTLPGIWSFPSGTQEESETPEETAIREAKEELGVKILPIKSIAIKELPEFSVRLNFLLCKITSGTPSIKAPEEINKINWLTFQDFFIRFQDSKIGHGLVWLRKNPWLWKEYS